MFLQLEQTFYLLVKTSSTKIILDPSSKEMVWSRPFLSFILYLAQCDIPVDNLVDASFGTSS